MAIRSRLRSGVAFVPGLYTFAKSARRFWSVESQRFAIWRRQKGVAEIKMETLPTLRQKALEYCERLRVPKYRKMAYRFSSRTKEPVLYASLYAVLLRHLVQDLDNVSEDEREEWSHFINEYQCADGLYRDPLIDNDIADCEDWWGWRHLTLHALMALTALGSAPRYPLEFISVVDTPEKVKRWLDSLNWRDRVSFTSNAVQNYCAALQYARDFGRQSYLAHAVKAILEELSHRCNPRTGLWGSGIADSRVALSEEVQAGYHFWLLYLYDQEDVPYMDKAFNSIRELQNPYGGFGLHCLCTSACQDIDGLDPMVRFALLLGKDGEVHDQVYKCLTWILLNFNDDGGAVFQRGVPFLYGHELMSSVRDESNLFATWFRMLSVAIACRLLQKEGDERFSLGWNFVDAPGHQFGVPYPHER